MICFCLISKPTRPVPLLIRSVLENPNGLTNGLESYHKLEHETSYDGLSSKEIEAKNCERISKEANGMKNARQFVKTGETEIRRKVMNIEFFTKNLYFLTFTVIISKERR